MLTSNLQIPVLTLPFILLTDKMKNLIFAHFQEKMIEYVATIEKLKTKKQNCTKKKNN